MLSVLAITNLYPLPWIPTQATFNHQQFVRLSSRVQLTVLVAVPWTEWIQHRGEYRRAAHEARRGRESDGPQVDYFVYWYLPRLSRHVNVLGFLLSLLCQHFGTIRAGGWRCLLGSWAYPDAVATSIVGRLFGIPVVAKVHGSDINRIARHPLRRWQVRRGLLACRRTVAVSAALARELETLGIPPQRISLVYNGVDSERFAPMPRGEARAALGLSNTGPIVLFVGNLLASKGSMDLVEAFQRLAGEDSDLTLVFVGDGPTAQPIHQAAAKGGVGDRIRLVGRQPPAAVRLWLCAANLLALPSHAEGVPNVVLEALSCGTPVVASRVGGIPEVLSPATGMLVSPGAPTELAEALRNALTRPWSTAAIQAEARRFDWDRNAAQMTQILIEAAAYGSSAARGSERAA